MKKIIQHKIVWLLLLIMSISFQLSAQTLGNEWINYSQKYYSFKVTKTGIYRITYAALVSAGVPIQTLNPKNIQLFGRGQEQYIYITNENTGLFLANDYIEFYAEKNDGWFDSRLYKNADDQINTEYSLFNDTSTYFLTFNNSVNNKRIVYDESSNYSSYTAAPWFLCLSKDFYNSEYIDGMPLISNSSGTLFDPEYVKGEGFSDNAFSLGGSVTKLINTANAYTGAGAVNAKINYLVNGASDYSSAHPNHHLRVQYAGNTLDTLYDGYKVLRFENEIPTSSLSNTTTSFSFQSINDIGSNADRNSVTYITVYYPRIPNLSNQNQFSLFVPDASASKTLLKLSSFTGGTEAVFYNLQSHSRHKIQLIGSEYNVLIPNTGNDKACFVAGSSAITQINSLKPVGQNAQFVDYIAQNPNFDYLIISHSSLMGNQSLQTATDYAAYRQSSGYNVLLIDVDMLYNQYSYGINKHPLAIKNFVRDANNRVPNEIKGMFLIGKSLRPIYYRKNAAMYNSTLVPTIGNPPTDILLSSGIVDSLYQPAIPTGRLSAQTVNHVDLYLEKIKEYEDPILNLPSPWMKNVLHFSGGATLFEQNQISSILHSWENIIEDTAFGGSVLTTYKNTTDPIQINLSEQIKQLVNNGVSLMTFFGHAAGIGFDISIDNPSEYQNKGKYPLLLANSCYAGDIFQQTTSGSTNSSEEFVLIRDKGMIGYVASVTPAAITGLNAYSSNFYKNITYREYGKPIGYSMKKVVAEIQTYTGNKNQMKEIAYEMTLHGDPAIILNSFDKPDYFINLQSVGFVPEVITTAIDSFDVKVVITNQGKAIADSMILEVQRSFPNGTISTPIYSKIKSTLFRDTILIKLPVDRVNGIGMNKIDIKIDAYSNIDELNESNNFISLNLNIKAADLSPVYPYEFAIVPNATIKLRASTFYPFTGEKRYVFELDTTKFYNSPLKQSTNFLSSGGVLEWTPSITLTDSSVYYWRVSLDSASYGEYNWRSSSFQYINGEEGWSQAHFYQFENDVYQLVKYSEAKRKFEFINEFKLITAQDGIYPHIPWTEIWYRVNNISYNIWTCIEDGVKIAVFNPTSGIPWYSSNVGGVGPEGNVHCTSYDWPGYEFPSESTTVPIVLSDTAWYQRTANFIAKIPDGYQVLVMSIGNHNAENYPEYLYKAYDSLGSNYIRSLTNNRPFMLYGKKGDLGNAHEIVGATTQSIINLTDSLSTNWKEGYVQTPIIGPSMKWKSLHWITTGAEPSLKDSVALTLIGIKTDGSEDEIFSGLTPDSVNVTNLNSLMDARDYPYCKLICYMIDDSFRTPVNINRWQLLFQSAPEIGLDPITHFTFHSDTIVEGDSLHMSIAIRNLSTQDMDSVLMHYWVVDGTQHKFDLGYKKIAPIPHQAFIIDTIITSTRGFTGNCFLWMEANPIDTLTGIYDQLEITHSNNLGEKLFYVLKDKENPLLDVTFDGVHILDGDIVSAKPEIYITLNDENKYISLSDTSLFKLYLTNPKNIEERIYFNGSIIEFIPAKLPDNKAKIVYNPTFASDGKYSLRVQARDASNNESGQLDYKIGFEIYNKATITEVMNWPNPFTTKTHFVFTLTGSQIPDYFKIQIMTITGKLVKEISKEELGPLHIGRNITEYYWDGTDEFGDRLANGVYLYRVITKIGLDDIEKSASGADQYFNKGFGKMYLMR